MPTPSSAEAASPLRHLACRIVAARSADVHLDVSYLPLASTSLILQPLGHQGEEGPQSGSVGFGGIELHSGGKQCCLIKALKALSLAFSRLSCSISLSSCFIRHSLCILRCS
jgi:hypothetical protein